MKNKNNGMNINGRHIHSIRFANNIVIVEKSEQDIKDMLKILTSVFDKFKLKIHVMKTKQCS